MMNTTSLSTLKEGESCRIVRLMDLGFISGAAAECLHISSGGDPAAYLISGTVIAIRKTDAERIVIMRNGDVPDMFINTLKRRS